MNKTLEKILEDELFSNETFEGEGNLQIKNTSEGTKMPITLSGNSYQKVTEQGKNKLKPIKFTENSSSLGNKSAENGIYRLDGNVSSNDTQGLSFRLTTSYKRANYISYIDNTDVDLFIEPGTYTISIKFLGGSINNSEDYISFLYRLDNLNDNTLVHTKTIGEIKPTTKTNEIIKTTFTVKEKTPFSVFATILRVHEDSSYSNIQWVMQLEEGEIATDYEPYGEMPSPEYPSEIKNCGDINLKITNNAEQEQRIIFPTKERTSIP